MSSPSWRREEEQRTQREYSWNYAAEGRGPSLSEKPSVYANYPTPSDGIGRQNVIPNYTPIERTSPMSFKAPTSKNKKIVIKETPQPSPSTYNKLSSAVGYITSPVKYITSMFSSRSEEATAEPAKKKIDVITKEKLKDASVLSVPVEQAKDRKEKKAAPTITIGDDKLKAPTEVTTLDGIKDLKAKLETVSNSKGKRNSGSGMRKNSNQGNKRAVSPHENKSRKTSVSPHENRKPMQVKQIKIEQSRNKSSFRIKSPDALEAQEKLEASFQNQQDSYRRRTLQKYVSSKSSDRRANQETDENLENGSNTQFGKWNHIQRPRPVRITSRKPENPTAQTGDVIVKNEVFNHSVLPVQTDIRKSTRNAPDRSNSASSHFTPIEPVVQDETVKRSTSITPSKIGGKTFAAYKEASKATPPVTSQGETQVVQTKPSDESPSAAPEKSADGINHLNVYSDERRTSPLKIKPQKKDRQKKGDNSSVETKKSQPSAGSGNATLNSAKGTSPIHNLKLENKTTSLENENNSPDVTPVSKTPPQERSRSVSKSPNRKSKSSVRKSSPLPIRKSSPSPVQKSSASPVNKLPGVLERKPIAPKRKRSTFRSPGPRRSRSRSASSASPVNKFFPKGSNSKLVKSFQTKQSQQQQ
ncbi:serine/arginine repetitive matrix protein 1 isoform X2 [Aplysia californica]|uniref:Serine/arginine repetitive matrix protein 1 isoform X2 n=1 Tax=Aplysia californica TaxID=6500 RepID=A0ABM1A5C1_APLCA|nr:serine/arginine repetitive matrix protein 1 isoform X2 [Aplysia californica]